MTFHKMADLAKLPDPGHFLRIPFHLLQFLPDGLAYKKAFRILRKHGKTAPEQLPGTVLLHGLSEHLHLAPVGLADAADGLQGGGFSRTVAAYDRI